VLLPEFCRAETCRDRERSIMPGMDEHVFPQRTGNEFQLLVDGDRFYPAMLEAVEQAQHYVLMEMYLVESGRVADLFCAAFVAAAQRGVCVQLLLDAFGARRFSRRDREHLVRNGIRLVSFNPLSLRHPKNNLLRTHRKFLLADASVVFVGGSGIADFFSGPHAWRETMVAVRGPLVNDWHTLFTDNWQRWSELAVPDPLPAHVCEANITGRVVWTATGRAARVPACGWPRPILCRHEKSAARCGVPQPAVSTPGYCCRARLRIIQRCVSPDGVSMRGCCATG
jgi:cardiolipin synthase